MMASPRLHDPQIIGLRDRDLNSESQMRKAVVYSALAHLAIIAVVVIAGDLFAPARRITPGVVVTIISPNQAPRSLQRPSVAKQPVVKKADPISKQKIVPPKTNKLSDKGKKIVVKKQTPHDKEVTEKVKPVKEAPLTSPATRKGAPEEEVAAGPTFGDEFEFIWYLRIVERRINEKWVTHGIDVTTAKGDPTVRFVITPNGAVQEVSLDESSGSGPLDQSAIAAVGAATFPALPAGYPEDARIVYFTFDYEQRNE
jgi:TonB family protein